MSVLTGPAADGDGPPHGQPIAAWAQSRDPSRAFDCGHAHRPGEGRLDEAARRLSHEELAVAELLAAEGHDVRSRSEFSRGGRHPDLTVCGSEVEVKSFAPLAERRREPSPQSVFNKLIDAAGQAPHVVLVAGTSGLTSSTVRRGLARYWGDSGAAPALASVRVLGDGYDLAWSRRPGLGVGGPHPGTPRRPPPDRGLSW